MAMLRTTAMFLLQLSVAYQAMLALDLKQMEFLIDEKGYLWQHITIKLIRPIAFPEYVAKNKIAHSKFQSLKK